MLRTIIFDPGVTRELYDIYGGAELADEAMEAVEWILSRDPEQGRDVGSGFWAIEHGGYGIWRRVIFYYDFSDTEVWIQGLRLLDDTDPLM
jgi:hypothetical protein